MSSGPARRGPSKAHATPTPNPAHFSNCGGGFEKSDNRIRSISDAALNALSDGSAARDLGASNVLGVDALLRPHLCRRGVKPAAERAIEIRKIGKAGVVRERSDGAMGEAQVGQQPPREDEPPLQHMFRKRLAFAGEKFLDVARRYA